MLIDLSSSDYDTVEVKKVRNNADNKWKNSLLFFSTGWHYKMFKIFILSSTMSALPEKSIWFLLLLAKAFQSWVNSVLVQARKKGNRICYVCYYLSFLVFQDRWANKDIMHASHDTVPAETCAWTQWYLRILTHQ